ncbi:MAG: 1,4-dihydroxy-6-naphthoate synthase [Lentisphaeria bacterium]|nr:1,4-dihydroxy-6-naphthoate synthase [Lentisphaeria bacterium]
MGAAHIKESIKIGFSSCPNDAFIFHAMSHGHVGDNNLSFEPVIEDVETLNQWAFQGILPVTKLSFHAFMKARDTYELLDAGAAFGFGCGPLVVSREKTIDFSQARVAVPGMNTTACMLLKAWRPGIRDLRAMRFDAILPAVRDGRVDAGVIIHEGRFVFERYGCVNIIDLGQWWERETQLPIPLGCVAIRKDTETRRHKADVERAIRASLIYARKHPDVSRPYIRSLAGEMDDAVIDAHIKLYVNDYSLSLGPDAQRVIERLEELQ